MPTAVDPLPAALIGDLPLDLPGEPGGTAGTEPPRAAVRGVTFLGDFLRPDGQGNPGGVDRPVAWLCNAVKRQVALASGLPVRLLSPTATPDLAAWLHALRINTLADAVWAAAYAELPARPHWDEPIERLVLSQLRGQFCVGWELPPYLIRLLERNMIPYIDIRIHPIRFMDDLMFAVRTSNPATRAGLGPMAVPEAEVVITAGLREAMCQFIGDSKLPQDTLVVLGQRPHDATQIVGGRFFDAAHHQERIAAILAHHRAVVLKPHPHEPEHSLLKVAAGLGGNVLGMVKDNLYRLLAMPQVTAILTVSSSAAHEARYFGKTVYTLGEMPLKLGWRGDPMLGDTYAALDDIVLSIDFWRRVLSPYVGVSPRDGVRLAPKPNRLRLALDSFWNFNEIDTDRLPGRQAAAPARSSIDKEARD